MRNGELDTYEAVVSLPQGTFGKAWVYFRGHNWREAGPLQGPSTPYLDKWF